MSNVYDTVCTCCAHKFTYPGTISEIPNIFRGKYADFFFSILIFISVLIGSDFERTLHILSRAALTLLDIVP